MTRNYSFLIMIICKSGKRNGMECGMEYGMDYGTHLIYHKHANYVAVPNKARSNFSRIRRVYIPSF